MDKKQPSPELSQAELRPTQEEQVRANPPSRKRQLDSDDDVEPRAERARTTRPTSERARTTRPTSEPAPLTRKNLACFNKTGKKGTRKAPPSASDPSNGSSGTSSGMTSTPSTTASGFADQVEGAPNEASRVYEVVRTLLKEYDDKGYSCTFNQAFTGYPEDVRFNNGLSAPKPDFVEGLRKREYRPFQSTNASAAPSSTRMTLSPWRYRIWPGNGRDSGKT